MYYKNITMDLDFDGVITFQSAASEFMSYSKDNVPEDELGNLIWPGSGPWRTKDGNLYSLYKNVTIGRLEILRALKKLGRGRSEFSYEFELRGEKNDHDAAIADGWVKIRTAPQLADGWVKFSEAVRVDSEKAKGILDLYLISRKLSETTEEQPAEKLYNHDEVNSLISARLARAAAERSEKEKSEQVTLVDIHKQVREALVRNLDQGYDSGYLDSLVALEKYLTCLALDEN